MQKAKLFMSLILQMEVYLQCEKWLRCLLKLIQELFPNELEVNQYVSSFYPPNKYTFPFRVKRDICFLINLKVTLNVFFF